MVRPTRRSGCQLTPRRLHQRGSLGDVRARGPYGPPRPGAEPPLGLRPPPDADGPDADPDPADAGDDRMWQPYA